MIDGHGRRESRTSTIERRRAGRSGESLAVAAFRKQGRRLRRIYGEDGERWKNAAAGVDPEARAKDGTTRHA
jgi:hypothetical protein